MPWKETSPMNERVKFVAAMLEAEESFGELCERFGISRKQGHKWRERYEASGVQGLVDRSRAPHSHPHAVSPAWLVRWLPPRRSIDLRCEPFLECCQSLSTQTTSRFAGLIPTVSSPGVGGSGTSAAALRTSSRPQRSRQRPLASLLREHPPRRPRRETNPRAAQHPQLWPPSQS
jgi:transposase-like protein